jgi:hypothetical protein
MLKWARANHRLFVYREKFEFNQCTLCSCLNDSDIGLHRIACWCSAHLKYRLVSLYCSPLNVES